MSQANVYTSLSNAIWYTDKCSISTGATAVTYQVYATGLGATAAVGNIYSGPPALGANKRKEIYVGVGNYITIDGTGYTATEMGTQTSAQAGTGNFNEAISPAPAVPAGSLVADGGDYLSLATTTAFGFGTGDFSFEGYFYHTAGGANHRFFDFRTTTPEVAPMLGVNGTNNIYYYVNGTTRITGPTISLNAWTHVAISRTSGSTKLFVNGTQQGATYADANNYGTTLPVHIAADYGGANEFVGYMSNMRIVKGVGVYTGNFTVPTSPLPDTQSAGTNISAIAHGQTQLLLNTSNNAAYLTDSSINNFTMTTTGSVLSVSTNPF